MEKSIESIGKEGFVNDDKLIAPKVNDLYNQKSIDIVAKFKRMYRINIIGIVLFSFIIVPVSYAVNIPYMGIMMFLLFNLIIIVNRKTIRAVHKIDNSLNSYEYLISFKNWTDRLIDINTRFSRFLYPYMFLTMFFGFWCGAIGGDVPGDKVVKGFVAEFPNTPLVFGFPLVFIAIMLFAMLFLALVGGRIGKWDFNLGYGRIMRRLNTMIKDMEELKK
jgi:hypothetical protein